MPHIPVFPPQWHDWAPGNPFNIQPPLPNFLWNPWLTPEQRSALEEEYGSYAAHRAEAMVGPRTGFEMARRAAHNTYIRYLSGLLPITAPAKVRKPRVKVPTLAEELAPLVKVLTPERETELVESAVEALLYAWEETKRRPTVEEIQEMERAVIDWAEEDPYKVKLSEAKATDIVKKATAKFDYELATRAPARRVKA